MRLRISKQELLRRREIRRQREKQLQDDRRNDIIEASKIGFVYGLICGALSFWILSSAIRRLPRVKPSSLSRILPAEAVARPAK